MFWGISDRFVTAEKLMQNWPTWCHYGTSSLNKVASEFFATNAPDPLHLPKTHVLGHFGPFRYCTKVDAKLADLVPLSHKFAKKVASEFFATNALDPLHLTQNSYFGALRTISFLHESRCKTGRTGAIIAQVC
jgi:hypothetical protein